MGLTKEKIAWIFFIVLKQKYLSKVYKDDFYKEYD